MKFYDLDLTQLIPHGIPLNSSSEVEYTNYINEFFLNGFTNWFGSLFTTSPEGLLTDYSRSCAAPNSLTSCMMCSDSQLEDAITEAGFKYYTANDHKINAKFMYDLENIKFGTEYWCTSVIQYISNTNNVFAKPIYDGYAPYHYGVYISGDITGSVNVSGILDRLVENINSVGNAHTQIDELTVEDTGTTVNSHVGICIEDISRMYGVEVSIPYDVWLVDYGNSRTATITAIRSVYKVNLTQAQNIINAQPTPFSAFNDILDGGPYTKKRADEIVSELYRYGLEREPRWNGIIESRIHVPEKPQVESDDPSKPLMFKSLEDGSTVKLKNNGTYSTYEISYDNESWSSYTFNSDITLNTDEKVYFRCTYHQSINNDSNYVQFVMTGKIEAYNNVNSMYSTDFANITTFTQNYVFYNLFYRCSALYKVPLLPATAVTISCYAGMFASCTNIVEPPALPATNLDVRCYAAMFTKCTSLTKAPELHATDLKLNCYYNMFNGCSNLTEVRCAALNPPSGSSSLANGCGDWLSGASTSGTFYANPDAVWPSNTSGIPSGWTRSSL